MGYVVPLPGCGLCGHPEQRSPETRSAEHPVITYDVDAARTWKRNGTQSLSSAERLVPWAVHGHIAVREMTWTLDLQNEYPRGIQICWP